MHINFDIISAAYADGIAGPAGAPNGGFGVMFIWLLVFFVIFYFILWRPQAKRQKEHRVLLNQLAKGDEVVTNGGLLGRINKVEENYILLFISDGVEVKFQKSAIAMVLPKGTIKSI